MFGKNKKEWGKKRNKKKERKITIYILETKEPLKIKKKKSFVMSEFR